MILFFHHTTILSSHLDWCFQHTSIYKYLCVENNCFDWHTVHLVEFPNDASSTHLSQPVTLVLLLVPCHQWQLNACTVKDRGELEAANNTALFRGKTGWPGSVCLCVRKISVRACQCLSECSAAAGQPDKRTMASYSLHRLGILAIDLAAKQPLFNTDPSRCVSARPVFWSENKRLWVLIKRNGVDHSEVNNEA